MQFPVCNITWNDGASAIRALCKQHRCTQGRGVNCPIFLGPGLSIWVEKRQRCDGKSQDISLSDAHVDVRVWPIDWRDVSPSNTFQWQVVNLVIKLEIFLCVYQWTDQYWFSLYFLNFQESIQFQCQYWSDAEMMNFPPLRIVGFQDSMHLLFRGNWQMYVNVLAGFKKWNEAAHLFRSVMCHKARASTLSSLLHGAGMTSIIKGQF